MLFTSIVLFAQYKRNTLSHEFSLSAGAGFSWVDYSLEQGIVSKGGGETFGLGYSILFNNFWGFNTGLEYNAYCSTASSNSFEEIYFGLNDGEGHIYDLHSEISGFKEKQQAGFLSVPLMFHIQTNTDIVLFANFGTKISIPVFANYQNVKNAMLRNRGYFPDKENWAINQRFMGFGTFGVEKNNGALEFNNSYTASVEAGVKIPLNDNLAIQTLFYCDYGLNDIVKDHSEKQYIAGVFSGNDYNYHNNSILTTSFSPNGQSTAFSGKTVAIAIGIKIRFALTIDNE
jgi:hypothetical protein